MTAAGLPSGGMLGIGAVYAQLRPDFPDVSISKIRYLEDEGLVTPVRTASGYRQYGHADVARLRFVLTAQRDHYLPLRVIRQQLDAIDRGLEPATPAPRLPRALASAVPEAGLERGVEVRLTRAELLAESGLSPTALAEVEQFGLITPGPGGFYGADAALLARTVGELVEAGLEPRHLRPLRTAADREVALIGQLVAPLARQKDPDARERAADAATELAAATLRLHALLVKTGLRSELGR